MTVDELKARRKELSAKKKALDLDGSDAIALCMVEEELMDYILQEPVNVGDKIPNELQSSDDSEAKTGTVL